MTLPISLRSLGWHFTDRGTGLGDALDAFLGSRRERPRLLALGEPTHGVETFPLLRNQAVRHLVQQHGYRSVAIESDCLAALVLDDYVTTGEGDLDHVMATGFSHGFGDMTSSRELVTWIRGHNEGRAPADQVRLCGFDAPMEMSGAASPRKALTALHRYLVAHLGPARVPHAADTVEDLVGDEEAWSNPAAAMDPTESVGGSAGARDLRVIADDLVAVVDAESPGLREASPPAEYARARMFGRAALGLLRYHAVMAEPTPDRVARMLAVRDSMMADNLLALAETETGRGPSLVFAHNGHLQRNPTRWHLAGMDLCWWSAGAIAATHLGSRYAVIASDLGAAPGQGIPEPAADTLEGLLAEATDDAALYPTDRISAALSGGHAPAVRADTPDAPGYFPLDSAQLGGVDGVAFVTRATASPGAR